MQCNQINLNPKIVSSLICKRILQIVRDYRSCVNASYKSYAIIFFVWSRCWTLCLSSNSSTKAVLFRSI